MYDLIGDIHGYATELKLLLQKLGYNREEATYRHPDGRKIIFVGDYIDRGPSIREVLQIVKGMTDTGEAIALMGNHEYNALAYAHQKDGNYLRKHNDTHFNQHKATLEQFAGYPEEWEDYKKWFYTLPIFIEQDGVQAVHACWNQLHINWLREHGYNTMTAELLEAAHIKGSESYVVINETLKGVEIKIPEEYKWPDKEGHMRTENRYKWWIDPKTTTYEHCLFNCPPDLKDLKVAGDIKIEFYPEDAPPVFFGHYWLEDELPIVQKHNAVCLDYSIAKTGIVSKLMAYRWSGEERLVKENFVFVGR